MLVFLDAGQNVKGAPNENFGREVMELFTMGVGNYSEKDIREAARAFTGWTNDDLRFKFDPAKHDAGEKNFSASAATSTASRFSTSSSIRRSRRISSPGRSTATSCATTFPAALQERLGTLLRENDYELKPLLRTVFLSKDFYSEPSVGTRIKGPVDLIVSMCRELGVKRLPGIPDFNSDMRRTRSGAAQSADGRRLGAGPKLDYAGHAARRAGISRARCCFRT